MPYAIDEAATRVRVLRKKKVLVARPGGWGPAPDQGDCSTPGGLRSQGSQEDCSIPGLFLRWCDAVASKKIKKSHEEAGLRDYSIRCTQEDCYIPGGLLLARGCTQGDCSISGGLLNTRGAYSKGSQGDCSIPGGRCSKGSQGECSIPGGVLHTMHSGGLLHTRGSAAQALLHTMHS